MKISDLLTLSLNNLRRRKGRTILTVLGVVIGTCSIVMMVSIGVALDAQQDAMFEELGDLTRIEVNNWGSYSTTSINGVSIGSSGSSSSSTDGPPPLTLENIQRLEEIPGVKVATPYYTSQIGLSVHSGLNGKYQTYGQIVGVDGDAFEDLGYTLIEGSFPSSSSNKKSVQVVVGSEFAYNFTDTKKRYPNNYINVWEYEMQGLELPPPFVDVLEDEMILTTTQMQDNGQEKTFEKDVLVTGVMSSDNAQDYYASSGMFMDLDTLLALEEEYNREFGIRSTGRSEDKEYDQVIVYANSVEDVESVITSIEDMGYSTFSMQTIRKSLESSTMAIQLILGGLGSISLLVAAIGIANTMTMAIYERTREIGIMKVLGCELKDIKNMFLIEAAGIGFLGGVFGIAISWLISEGLNAISAGYTAGFGAEPTPISIIPLWLIVLGMAFATFVGTISGLIPSLRAVKITALSAIRHE